MVEFHPRYQCLLAEDALAVVTAVVCHGGPQGGGTLGPGGGDCGGWDCTLYGCVLTLVQCIQSTLKKNKQVWQPLAIVCTFHVLHLKFEFNYLFL